MDIAKTSKLTFILVMNDQQSRKMKVLKNIQFFRFIEDLYIHRYLFSTNSTDPLWGLSSAIKICDPFPLLRDTVPPRFFNGVRIEEMASQAQRPAI